MKTVAEITGTSYNLFTDILDNIPYKIILLNQHKIFYLNKAAADFLCIGNAKLFSDSFLDLIHPDFKSKIHFHLNLFQSEGNYCEKIPCKIVLFNGNIINVEFQFFQLELNKKKFVQVIFNEIEAAKKFVVQNAILKIFQVDNSINTLEETCDYLYGIVKEIVDIKNFYVALYDKQTQDISFPYYKDQYNPKPAKRKFGNGLTEFVLKTKKTLLLNDKKINEKINDGTILPSFYSVKGWLGVPLIILEDIAGVIVIKEYEREKFLDENIKQIIEFVSFPISRVIERKIIEETRKNYTEKLVELNNSKDKFFSIISHDLKSPFNSILGFTEILKEQNESLEKKELQEIYEALYNSTRKTFNLLNNLLQYSRFQTGLEDFNPTKLNLTELIKDILVLYEGTTLKKQIKIINNVNDNFSIFADKEMFNSILRNLINNAIKFSYIGGKIYIDASNSQSFIKISVKDCGIGMNKETMNNLFKIESKKSTPGTNKEEGTGLGLILVKEFVERNGGKIFVKSEVGVGTEISFTVKANKTKSNIEENSLN